MLSRIFDMDNVVFRFFRKLGYIWWLHILWLVCSIPVITIGASTTALCYSCMRLHENEAYVTRSFFKSFKQNFRQSTILFLGFLIMGAILVFDIIAGSQMNSMAGNVVKYAAIILVIPYAVTLLYVFAVQAKFFNPVSKTIKYSLMTAAKFFPYTIKMFFIMLLFIVFNMTIVLANFVTVSIGVGVVAYLLSFHYNKVFSKIISKEEENRKTANLVV